MRLGALEHFDIVLLPHLRFLDNNSTILANFTEYSPRSGWWQFFTTLVLLCWHVWISQLSVTQVGYTDVILLWIGKTGSILQTVIQYNICEFKWWYNVTFGKLFIKEEKRLQINFIINIWLYSSKIYWRKRVFSIINKKNNVVFNLLH